MSYLISFLILASLIVPYTGREWLSAYKPFTSSFSSEKKTVEKLVSTLPNSRVSKFKSRGKTYFAQEMNANDAVITIYDKGGNKVGVCDYWNKVTHPLCSKMTKSKVVYVPDDNVWGIKGVNVYKVTPPPNGQVVSGPANMDDTSEAEVVRRLVDNMSNSRVSTFTFEGKTYFAQEMNANDAVITIYDKGGNKVGVCDYWNKVTHPLCSKMTKSKVVYVPDDNVWGIKGVNVYKVTPTGGGKQND